MFSLTDHEKGKLILLSGDRTTVEGLKKLFLSEFLKKRDMADVNVLAARGIAVDFLNDALRVLENLKEKIRDEKEHENVI